jgi:FAD/FMN-containing dehydrogenase
LLEKAHGYCADHLDWYAICVLRRASCYNALRCGFSRSEALEMLGVKGLPVNDSNSSPHAALSALRAALKDVTMSDSPAELEKLSRDYYWYSPILTEALDGKRGELIVRPASQAQVVQVAAACTKHRVPLTVRGGGTGNYGQCVPLAGGVILDTSLLSRIEQIVPGVATVQTGALMGDINDAARKTGQQLCMFPSTERIATIGGFIAGGHSGIGSIRHGILKDPGNVSRIRVVTLEDVPQVLDLRGADIEKVHHAYGTNGIIAELDVRLTEAIEWLHTITLFDSYADVLRFGMVVGDLAVNHNRQLDVFQLSAVERRITPYYEGMRGKLQDKDVMFAQVSPASIDAFKILARQMGGEVAVCDTEAALMAQGLPSATECAYNHTTLQALKHDRNVTYLQVAFPHPFSIDLVVKLMDLLRDEVYMHHEFSKSGNELVAFALPLVQYFDAAQIRHLIKVFEDHGCWIFDPHTYILEDGGMKQVDEAQLAFKQLADPHGLMNPGKMRAWDERSAKQGAAHA